MLLQITSQLPHAFGCDRGGVDDDGGVLVTTTDVHLAHGIGEALHHAYKGNLDSHYNREEKLLRVRWSR